MRTWILAAAATALVAACGGSGPEEPADLVLLNGDVYTLDDERPAAEAVAIRGERIAVVGSDAEAEALVGPDTRVIDLDGAFVSPGFNDGHVHVESTGALIVGVNLLEVHEPDGFREEIARAAERLAPGSWITRGDWGAYEEWEVGSTGREGEGGEGEGGAQSAGGPFTPHRDLIDDVTPNHPVLVNRFDRFVYLANSLALDMAGITDATPSPPGGMIAKDEDGRVTGILTGSAVDLVRAAITPKSFEQRLTEVRAVLQEAREGGVTTIQDITSSEQFRAYQELHARGELTARINIRPSLDNVTHTGGLGITRGFGDDWLRFIGYKAWVDGIMGGSSAMFYEQYDHAPGNFGIVRQIMLPEGIDGLALSLTRGQNYAEFPEGNLQRLMEEAVPTGLPPHIHAIGDKAVKILLDLFEAVLSEHDMIEADHRWRMIHAQVVEEADFHRFGELNLVAEVNPYHISDDMRWMEERIGGRSRGAYAFRSLKDAGAVLVFGSDSPGTNAARYFLHPRYGLYAAVSRQTLTGEPAEGWFPEQRLTIEEAIEAYTRNPAWASFEEDIKGTLTPGKLADIAVFDVDLVEAGRNDPARLLEAEALYTIVGGRVVHERGAP
ncbi:amidohydrolase [Candidatus Palauibacter soopunensis]|uniref:amidohydrolase n=1 Tax=Candidatus Palauibacter soopunensis TaxID=3056739 RepID=UPI0023A78FE0|nr:amidohydrolase [Candidatus Palauibacter soopunensis]MDE2877364.1 amidohydrolase [Candidatus Palauibacter soopunensis]